MQAGKNISPEHFCTTNILEDKTDKKINKSELMTLNTPSPDPVQVDGTDLPIIEEFIYLGSTVRGAGSNIKS